MCGRFGRYVEYSFLAELYGARAEGAAPAGYNIAPSQEAAVLVEERGRVVRPMRWGLIPRWAKDETIAYKTVNARLETVLDKPAYRASIRDRRCLIPVNGFFEWDRGDGKTKQPYWIRLTQDRIMPLAGLWDRSRRADGSTIDTFTVLTTGANGLVAAIHNRMPVIPPAELIDAWLDPAPLGRAETEQLINRLGSCPVGEMTMDPVSAAVNSAGVDGPELIEPIRPPQTGLFD